MKKNITIIAAALLVIIGGFYAYSLYQSELKSEISDEPLSDFNIKDTANINKIVITEKDLGQITLLRNKEEQKWYIEANNMLAQKYNVNLILETAFQVQIKQNVSEELKETILTQLAVRYKKVEYYLNDESHPTKTWFVGSGTNDHMGTFMLLEIYDPSTGTMKRSPEPYIMHKPGVYATLDTRFFTNIAQWIFPGVFIYDVGEIKKIEVAIKNDPSESYSVEISDKGRVSLNDAMGKAVPIFDSSQVKHYVTHYREIYYESPADFLDATQKDSVLSLVPDFKLTVTDKNGKKQEARVWKIKKLTDEVDLKSPLYDTGRALCSVNGSKELVTIQYFSWDVLLKPLSYYLPKKSNPFQY